ncbi:MAG: TnsA endonuclease N-terminal domain-containing protein [Zoogloeaceae bacterium]|nr:TnsA endonuclease N-terminal domain-containing protein [Zoogloeaceae bacterium]
MAAKVIEIDMGEDQRMRRVVSRSNHRVTGKYPSWKKRRMAYWESAIERDAFRRLDADASVLSFQEQPARIVYEVGGIRHIHYPDILVEWASGKEFIEVKSNRDATSEDVTARTDALKTALAARGFGYRVWPEYEIRVRPRLDNEIYLLRYGQDPVPVIVIERLRRLFQVVPIITWSALVDSVLAPGGLAVACRLVLDGWLLIDRDLPLTRNTAVRFAVDKGEAK